MLIRILISTILGLNSVIGGGGGVEDKGVCPEGGAGGWW